MSFIIGLELGQSQDYTAITVVERVRVGEAPQAPMARYGAVGEGVATGAQRMAVAGVDTRQLEYHVRHLERPALGTKYPTIVARVKDLLATPPLTLHIPLVIDRTGVGVAVTDLFEGPGVRQRTYQFQSQGEPRYGA